MKELVNNNKVIGGLTEKASVLAAKFYDTFNTGEKEITDTKTTELVKLLKCFRDVILLYERNIIS